MQIHRQQERKAKSFSTY